MYVKNNYDKNISQYYCCAIILYLKKENIRDYNKKTIVSPKYWPATWIV